MSNMEFWTGNLLNTTTMVTPSAGGTSSVDNLFDSNVNTYFTSVGDNNDATETTIRIEFSSSKNIDRIALTDINWRGFNIYYNSNTANRLALSAGSPTTTSIWSSNSTTSLLLKFTTITASIITIEITTTMAANEEKEISELWIGTLAHTFVYNPEAGDYDPKLDRQEYRHEMSDGGVSTFVVQDNFKATIKRKYVDTTEFTGLKTLYQSNDEFCFIPFPTVTSWDAQIYEVVWTGDFEFYQYTTNYKGNGYSGKMTLEGVPK
jgi:hypothetical protein